MKFAASSIFALSALASFVSGTPTPAPESAQLSARDKPNDGECIAALKYEGTYHFTYEEACRNLVENCRSAFKNAPNTTDIWGVKSCVAAATCQGTAELVPIVQCTDGGASVPNPPQTESLDYNIYAGIVGDCAWQEGGCPITQQNYIDFVYGTLTEIGTSSWPDVNNVINWWNYITAWAATGETVPYTNFNDWLHYSNSS